MDKKTIIIIVPLVLLILFFWPLMQWLGFVKEQPPQQAKTSVDTTAIATGDTTAALAERPPETIEIPVHADTTTTAHIPQPDTALLAQPDTIRVTTKKYLLTLISRGGGPISIKLKDYTYKDGTPVELLPEATAPTPDARFADGTVSTSRLIFASSLPPGNYEAIADTLELVYRFDQPGGEGAIIKRYRFYPDVYHYDLVIEVNNRAQLGFERKYQVEWNTPPGVTEPNVEMDYQSMEVVAMMAGSREDLKDFQNDTLNQSLSGDVTWAGVRSKYFAGVIIPHDVQSEGVFAHGFKRKITTPEGKIEQRKVTAGIELNIETGPALLDSFTIFAGPLDYEVMERYDVGLEDMLGIGSTPVIGILIKPFAWAIIKFLPRMYTVIPNYGLVIIIFALLVKILTLPLSMKSFKSMNAMKELQPKIKQLQERLKKNPQQLNAEMMKLYKAHGVNPMSGCLPMLPQMPLFFALFSVFRSTILLRQAPFAFFIDDLSRGASSFTDPYIILVLLMILTQFLSQQLTMASTQQNKMLMYIMPLFMGFIFYKFSAGLVLYWTCFSAFSLIDYFVFKRRQLKTEPGTEVSAT